MRACSPALAALVVALVATTLSCFNPVHSDAVTALGDEVPGVPKGATHRAGQPCLVCHGGNGPGPDFAIAGTVFETSAALKGANSATVRLIDAKGKKIETSTNTVGNFYLEAGKWSPTYPVSVTVLESPTSASPKVMATPIGRQTSCAACHSLKGASRTTELPVYVGAAPTAADAGADAKGSP